jgi:hypothetical protein
MKNIFAVVIALCLGGTTLADVPISKDFRMKNKAPGVCVWCAIEALGRHHGYEKLKGLVDRHNEVGHQHLFEKELKVHKVKYEIASYRGTTKNFRWKIDEWTIDTWDTSWLEYASDKKLGCCVVLRVKDSLETHMVVLTEFDKNAKIVKIIDSNNTNKETETQNLSWFLYWWDGYVIIIYPKE